MRHAIAVAILGKISPRVAHRIPRGIIRSGIKYRRNLNKFKRCNRMIGKLKQDWELRKHHVEVTRREDPEMHAPAASRILIVRVIGVLMKTLAMHCFQGI